MTFAISLCHNSLNGQPAAAGEKNGVDGKLEKLRKQEKK
jgi:hypothetical protein